MTILVTASGAGKTPRSFKGGVLEDEFRAEIRGYWVGHRLASGRAPTGDGAVWPRTTYPLSFRSRLYRRGICFLLIGATADSSHGTAVLRNDKSFGISDGTFTRQPLMLL